MEKAILNLKKHFTSTLNSDKASNKIITIPNIISFLRILLIPVFAYYMWIGHGIVALFLMIICGFSDFVDGYIARASGQITKLGKILDPIADRLMIFITLIMLTVLDILPIYIVAAVFFREAMLFFLYGCLILNGKEIIPVTLLGKTASAGLLISMPLIYLVSILNLSAIHLFVLILLYISLVLYWLTGLVYAKKTLTTLKTVGKRYISKVVISGVITCMVALGIVLFLVLYTPIYK